MRRGWAGRLGLYAVPLLFALVGNVATGSLPEEWDAWLPWVVWPTTAVLFAGVLVTEFRRNEPAPEAGGPAGLSERLGHAGRDLADALRGEWRLEEERRGVNDPFPLPVRWRVAPEEVFDHWSNIRREPPEGSGGPLHLDGVLDEFLAVFLRIPSRRLVILGGPGAGKTILVFRAAQAFLEADTGLPVPVVFSLGSWDPDRSSIYAWMAGQLERDHRGLAAPTTDGRSLAAALVDTRRILPILDGFDELADGRHASALQALSRTDMPLIVTSRPDEYRAAVESSDVLTAAAAVQLETLGVTELVAYLPRSSRKSAGGSTAWQPVLEALAAPAGEDPAADSLRAVLRTPLMLFLAKTVYSDAPGRDPGELLDAGRFPTPEAVESHLLRAFVPAVYGRTSGPGEPCDVDRAIVWLGHLADHLARLGTPDLAWWRLVETVPRSIRVTAMALVSLPIFIVAAILGIGYSLSGTTAVICLAAAIGGSFALGGPQVGSLPAKTELRLRRRGRGRPVLAGIGAPLGRTLAGCAAAGALAAVLAGWLTGAGFQGAVAVSWTLVFLAVVGGMQLALAMEVPLEVGAPESPDELLAADRDNALRQSLVAGCFLLLGVTVMRGLDLGIDIPSRSVWFFVTVIAVAPILVSAWGSWLVCVRLVSLVTGRLPWRLAEFLEDAHRRGVLRRVGSVYQFRHGRLQDTLAESVRGPDAGAERPVRAGTPE